MKKKLFFIIALGLIILGILLGIYLTRESSRKKTASNDQCAPWINVNIGDNKEEVLNTCQYSLTQDETDENTYIYAKAEYQGAEGVVKVTFSNDSVKELQWICVKPSADLLDLALDDAKDLYGSDFDKNSNNNSTHYTWKKKLSSSVENTIFISQSDTAFIWNIY